MTATDEALAQLNALLSEYESHRVQQTYPGGAGTLMLIQRFLAAIDRLTVPTSTYAHAAARQADAKTTPMTRLTELAANSAVPATSSGRRPSRSAARPPSSSRPP